MRKFYLLFFLLFFALAFSQGDTNEGLEKNKSLEKRTEKPSIFLYKIYSLKKDTTFVDTSMTIKSEYKYNMLRKDNFGLLAFSNEAHTYNTLDFGLINFNKHPNIGFTAKHFNYLQIEDIQYFSVPTPLTELYFKTVMEQGQSVDAFLTLNTKPNLNFSIAYKGIRSIGKYVNNISSSGNFRFTSSYFTINKKYILNAHFTGQDISNQENGGIINTDDFEINQDDRFTERERIDVYFEDATSFLKGNRFFIDHSYKLSNKENGLVFNHQFSQEYKFFEITQRTLNDRFGTSFSNSINNKTRFNNLYNRFGVAFKSKLLGNIEFFVDDTKYNYFYNGVIFDGQGNITIPNSISDRINSFGGSYVYNSANLVAKFDFSNTISNQNISDIHGSISYTLNQDFKFNFEYHKLNKMANLNYILYQNDYVDYNWFNNFKNEKHNQFKLQAITKWVDLEAKFQVLNDYLYFDNETNTIELLKVKPFQYDETINYLSIKASKEIKFGKFSLDNVILYQSVDQLNDIVNVPQIVTRNTFYFSDKVFKKAMQIQTGFIFNYFTAYNANDYNPLIGEFYVQNEKKIGNFPMIDFFVNARVRQTRIFLKAEHFNSSFTGYNFYSAPNYPYRDFIVRFGLVWNFFQ